MSEKRKDDGFGDLTTRELKRIWDWQEQHPEHPLAVAYGEQCVVVGTAASARDVIGNLVLDAIDPKRRRREAKKVARFDWEADKAERAAKERWDYDEYLRLKERFEGRTDIHRQRDSERIATAQAASWASHDANHPAYVAGYERGIDEALRVAEQEGVVVRVKPDARP